MDILSMTGMLLALVAILGGNILEGGHTASLVQMTAFVIVAGGTLGAVMVQTPIRTFVRAMKIAVWVVVPVKLHPEEAAEKIVSWSNIARREGLLGLEAIAEEVRAQRGPKGLADKEIVALVAYLQRLGTDIKWRPPEKERRPVKAGALAGKSAEKGGPK